VPDRLAKQTRQDAIIDLIRTRRVHNQDELRRLLGERGLRVTQATLSRDLRELRVAKLPHAGGESYYAVPTEAEDAEPALEQLIPHLLLSAEGVGNLIVLKTLVGGAQTVAEAIDLEGWPEIMGTLAGDDTLLIIVREAKDRPELIQRLQQLAGW
jgi:transcriptional regulator of arginine metabolism